MFFRRAAVFAVIVSCCEPAAAQSPPPLTLDRAFSLTLTKHPELGRFAHLRDAASAVVDAEGQRPPLRVGLDVENAFQSAESTLSLASVLERGGKREARMAIADAQLDALTLQQEQRRADVLAEVARRYLDLLATQSSADLADLVCAQRERVLEAIVIRVRAGATSEAVRLGAEASLARAVQQRERLRAETVGAARRLSILWSTQEPEFERVVGDLLDVPAIPTRQALHELVASSPELRRFADESRLREARLQLARSARAPDIEWRVGVRRLEREGDWAAVVGVSVPIGSASRAEPGIRAARAELAALELARESESLTLESTLIDAHVRFETAAGDARALRDDVLPRYEAAERAAERTFRAGALTYTDWAQLQAETVAARHERLDAALDAHRALIEIQRLTGTSLVLDTATDPRKAP